MNRKIALKTIQYFVNIVSIAAIITLLIVYKNDVDGYFITLWILMSLALVNIIIIGLKEYFIKEYNYGKFTLVMHATYCVINCGAYYLVKYVGGYDKYFYLYWLLSYLGTVVVIIMFTIFNMHTKDEKPKFRINK